MKKQTVSLLTVLLAVSGVLFSCGNKSNNSDKPVFDSVMVNETAHLFGDAAKPACTISINFAYISQMKSEVSKDSLNKFFLAACFGDEYANADVKTAPNTYKDEYTNKYKTDLEPLYTQDQKEQKSTEDSDDAPDAWYSYSKNMKGSLQYENTHYLVYRVYYDEYTGGAHGIYMTTFLNMDLQTLRPIRLDDLFMDDYKEPLTNMLWAQLLTKNGIKSRQEAEELGYTTTGTLEPTENFYLDETGITFYYNVYEITPYSMGPVSITLPYKEMSPLMKADVLTKYGW
jgi:hypothetical protein